MVDGLSETNAEDKAGIMAIELLVTRGPSFGGPSNCNSGTGTA